LGGNKTRGGKKKKISGVKKLPGEAYNESSREGGREIKEVSSERLVRKKKNRARQERREKEVKKFGLFPIGKRSTERGGGNQKKEPGKDDRGRKLGE